MKYREPMHIIASGFIMSWLEEQKNGGFNFNTPVSLRWLRVP